MIYANSESSDQTAQMQRLVCFFVVAYALSPLSGMSKHI